MALFRAQRLEEPVELYASLVDDQQRVVRELLKRTLDLQRLDDQSLLAILTAPKYRDAFRYLAGPPVSDDDWGTLAEIESLAPSRLRDDADAVRRLAQVVVGAVDRRRFPWLAEGRRPTRAERNAAVLASACLWAYQRTQTERRSSGKKRLEGATQECLKAAGLAEAARRSIGLLTDAPPAGEFCGETSVVGRRADFVVGLWDGRHALIECKDSNSLVNSVKRLNNDTAAKAAYWLQRLGAASVVPIAVISGVYSHDSLLRAQEVGLRLFWEHGMEELAGWLGKVRASAPARRRPRKTRGT